MKWLALVALVAACSKEPSEPFDVVPGTGGPGGKFRPDAPAPIDDSSLTISGRVCKLAETAHTLAGCAPSGAAGYTVMLGSAMATTADDGAFTLMRPAVTTGLVWRVSGTDIIPAAMLFGSATTIPAIETAAYEQMVTQMSVPISAALMVRFTRAGFGVQDATVTSQPAPDSAIFYDGVSFTEWETDATGTYGVVWIPSISPGDTTLTVSTATMMTTLTPLPVFADTITFASVEIP